MLIIGLTGSIAMGKSNAADHIAGRGVPVFSADAVVHELYENEAVDPLCKAFPDAVKNGKVDRQRLSQLLLADPDGFARLEAIVHPLVRRRREAFIADHLKKRTPVVMLDIPLLFETHMEDAVDVILLVTASPEIQAGRVMGRPGMTAEKFAMIKARQVPDEEKRRRADFVIDTGGSFEDTARQLDQFLESVHTWPQRAASQDGGDRGD